MFTKYVIKDGAIVPEPNTIIWAHWFQNADRNVARTETGGYVISTVFLGTDYRLDKKGRPILFETMVFCDNHEVSGFTERDETWDEATERHAAVVQDVAKRLARGLLPSKKRYTIKAHAVPKAKKSDSRTRRSR
jgi:hypothetical protein